MSESPQGGEADSGSGADGKEFSEEYKDSEWLYQKYHVEGLTHREIASKFGLNNGTISYWMDKHDIDCPDAATAKRLIPPKLRITNTGYVWVGGNGTKKHGSMLHPLIAIADGADPYEVYSKEGVVHHKNGLRWDNRPENLEVTTNSEHIKHHHENGDMDYTGLDNVGDDR